MPLCKNKTCRKQASFGLEMKKPLYCKTHKEDNMKMVRGTFCKHEECNSRASFGLKKNRPQYCSKHKLEGDV